MSTGQLRRDAQNSWWDQLYVMDPYCHVLCEYKTAYYNRPRIEMSLTTNH